MGTHKLLTAVAHWTIFSQISGICTLVIKDKGLTSLLKKAIVGFFSVCARMTAMLAAAMTGDSTLAPCTQHKN